MLGFCWGYHSTIFNETWIVLFGLLWAFDAFWKWHLYFLKHGVDNLV